MKKLYVVTVSVGGSIEAYVEAESPSEALDALRNHTFDLGEMVDLETEFGSPDDRSDQKITDEDLVFSCDGDVRACDWLELAIERARIPGTDEYRAAIESEGQMTI